MIPISLQISLAPSDYKHSIYLLEHQLKAWSNQVDEIIFTYDIHKSKGRFSEGWEENNEKMWLFLLEIVQSNDKIKLIKIDYSPKTVEKVSKIFFKKGLIPAKDYRGGPFYTYFFGLHASKNDYVFHIDSDMFFGGLSQTWSEEAITLMEKDPTILTCSPLPGPPKSDGSLINQVYSNYKNINFMFEFKGMSTRLYLIDKRKLVENKLNLSFTKGRSFVKAFVERNPPFKLPEAILSDFMLGNNLRRVDFLGADDGMWSIHPPYRTQKFYETLPELIHKIETADVPEDQKGFYDMTDSLCDWQEAREKIRNNRWWKRFFKR